MKYTLRFTFASKLKYIFSVVLNYCMQNWCNGLVNSPQILVSSATIICLAAIIIAVCRQYNFTHKNTKSRNKHQYVTKVQLCFSASQNQCSSNGRLLSSLNKTYKLVVNSAVIYRLSFWNKNLFIYCHITKHLTHYKHRRLFRLIKPL